MEFFSLNASLFWFLLGVIFLVVEAMTPGFFLLFFGLGAWVVSLLSLFQPLPQTGQWLIFIVTSVLGLLVFRRKLKIFFQSRLAKSGPAEDPLVLGQYVGREVVILEEVAPDEPGLAELNGTNWQARSDGERLLVGQRARVLRLEGLTLVLTAHKAN